MTKMLAILAAAMLSTLAYCAEPFFCGRQGARLVYRRTEVANGQTRWMHTMSIITVSAGKDGVREVAYSSDFRKAGGAQMYGGPIALQASIAPDGDVTMDVAASLSSVFANYLSESSVSSTGGSTTLPADMKPGDVLPDVHAVSKASLLTYRTDITERKILREETIDTPAGRFQCMVVQEHKVEKGPGRNRTTTALTWYCRGVGMVRHDTYDSRMKLETSEVLQEIL